MEINTEVFLVPGDEAIKPGVMGRIDPEAVVPAEVAQLLLKQVKEADRIQRQRCAPQRIHCVVEDLALFLGRFGKRPKISLAVVPSGLDAEAREFGFGDLCRALVQARERWDDLVFDGRDIRGDVGGGTTTEPTCKVATRNGHGVICVDTSVAVDQGRTPRPPIAKEVEL